MAGTDDMAGTTEQFVVSTGQASSTGFCSSLLPTKDLGYWNPRVLFRKWTGTWPVVRTWPEVPGSSVGRTSGPTIDEEKGALVPSTTIRSGGDFTSMDSNNIINEFVSIGIINKNADHAHARQRALAQAGSTLALKSRAVAHEEDDDEYDEEEVDDDDPPYDQWTS